MNAIEQGIITDSTKERLIEAEGRKKSLLLSIAKEEIKKPPITKEHIEYFLYDMKNKIYSLEERKELIISTFVNAVYLYDDKLIITYNLKDGEKLKKLELTELEKFGFNDKQFTNQNRLTDMFFNC